jgi:hypothetical protein
VSRGLASHSTTPTRATAAEACSSDLAHGSDVRAHHAVHVGELALRAAHQSRFDAIERHVVRQLPRERRIDGDAAADRVEHDERRRRARGADRDHVSAVARFELNAGRGDRRRHRGRRVIG